MLMGDKISNFFVLCSSNFSVNLCERSNTFLATNFESVELYDDDSSSFNSFLELKYFMQILFKWNHKVEYVSPAHRFDELLLIRQMNKIARNIKTNFRSIDVFCLKLHTQMTQKSKLFT